MAEIPGSDSYGRSRVVLRSAFDTDDGQLLIVRNLHDEVEFVSVRDANGIRVMPDVCR